MKILTNLDVLSFSGDDGFVKGMSGRLPVYESEFREFYGKIVKPKIKQLLRGRVSEDELWDEIVKAIYLCFGDVKEINKPIRASFLRTVFHESYRIPIPGVLDIYKRILYYPMRPGKGGKVGKGVPEITLISDITEDLIPLVHEWHPDIFEIVKDEIWSCKVEQVITDPGFFKFLLMGLEGEADEYLFISKDSEAVDLAQKAGIPAIRFKSIRQLEKEMTQLGFMFSPPPEKEGEIIRIGFSEE